MKSTFSIIIPVKELNAYLLESLPILLNLKNVTFEVLVLPNVYRNSSLNTVVSLEALSLDPYFKELLGLDPKLSPLKVIPTGPMGPAGKRDLGAQLASYDILAFLDDDAYPKEDWLNQATKYFDEGLDALGGPAITPPSASLLEKASGLVFETLLGGGSTRFRYQPVGKPFYTDDFPTVNFLVRKNLFLSVGGFDNEYWPGEDTKFCLDFIKAGHKILYVPEVQVWHHRRTLFAAHLKQISAYGRHRGYFVKKFPETSLRLTYFIPSLFFLFVIFGWTSLLWSKIAFGIYLTSVFSVFFFGCLNAFWLSKEFLLSILTGLGIFVTHLFYGFHFIQGLLAKNLRSKYR